MLENFGSITFLGNTLKNYAIFGGVFLVSLLVFKIFQKVILDKLNKIAERTKNDIDDEFIKIVRSLKPPFYSFLAFYLALRFLVLTNFLRKFFNFILIVWLVYQIIIALEILINYILRKKFSGKDKQTRAAAAVTGIIVKITLWSFAFLLVLQNFGVNVSSLVAGLGIGGIAVALAVQNILGDLLSSFAIYFDKPFVPGDFIIIGDIMGTVEKIGIKTTRLTALQGEEIVISNKDLTATKIQNFKKMKRRRISFNFGVLYKTTNEKLREIPKIVKDIIDSVSLVSLDRAHFKEFGDFALIFEVVYYVESSDYNKYMDVQQEINLRIKEMFEKKDIKFAYPTQAVYLPK